VTFIFDEAFIAFLWTHQVSAPEDWKTWKSRRCILKKGRFFSAGVDVMITIFCDFRQFLAKKLAFFSKTNVMIKILHNLAFVLSRKRQFFSRDFFAKIKKNHNIGPRYPTYLLCVVKRGFVESFKTVTL
jgi:hypothetical protein